MAKSKETQENKELQQVSQDNKMGIFQGLHFPDIIDNKWIDGSESIITPEDILELEQLYASTSYTMDECATEYIRLRPKALNNKLYNITPKEMLQSWQNKTRKSEVCRTLHTVSKSIKADTIGGEALKQYTGELPPFCFTTNALGEQTLSGAGVTYINNKHNALLKHAEILERGTWDAKREQADKAIIVNNNISVSLKDLMNQPIDNLIDADFTDAD